MSLQSDELEDRNIVGKRKSLAMTLQQNWINAGIVVLIITYALLTFLFMAVDKGLDDDLVRIIYHSVESVFIVLFILEIIFYKYAFKELYLHNKFNIINLVLTGIIVWFWVTDIFVEEYCVSVLLRTRGVMRLLHVPVILESMKSYHRLQKSLSIMETKDEKEKPNAERVVETLLQISDIIEEPKIYNDLHFCIKQIASGKLYEVEQVDIETEEVKSLRRRRGAILQMEETAWIRSATRIINLKRDSNDSGTIIMAAGDNRSLESLLNLNWNLTETMESLDTMEFNMFAFKEKTKNRELTTLTSLLLHKHSLYSGLHISINKFLVFMDKITSGYNKSVRYHNDTHAADVCQTLYYFIINGNWITLGKLDNIDIWSMILAAAVHDYEHPGLNNMFLINSKDTLALRYNDIGVLENHHIASSSALMKLEKYNIFSKLAPDDAMGIRQRMIHMVLSTDMSKHFSDLGNFKQKSTSENFEPDDKDKLLWMGVGIHLADISNPTKAWELTLKWTELLFEEFFKQGDKERDMGLKISDLMDRSTVNIAKAQLGFIDVIVNPAFNAFSVFWKWLTKNIKNMKKNRETWESRIEEYHERMLGNIKRIENNVIEEAKSESEESSASNKMSSFTDSNDEFTDSDYQTEMKKAEQQLKLLREKSDLSKPQSNAVPMKNLSGSDF